MSKQKKQAKPERPTLEEYSEYDDPRKRREIRSMYRDLMNETQSMSWAYTWPIFGRRLLERENFSRAY